MITECGEGELETSGKMKTDEWKDVESWGVSDARVKCWVTGDDRGGSRSVMR